MYLMSKHRNHISSIELKPHVNILFKLSDAKLVLIEQGCLYDVWDILGPFIIKTKNWDIYVPAALKGLNLGYKIAQIKRL